MGNPVALNPFAAMSLAGITYLSETGPGLIGPALQALGETAGGPWTLKWGPATDEGIMIYVAQSAGGSWGVAIRGSLSDDDMAGFFANWFEDADAVTQQPWLYPQSVEGARISSGMNDALDEAMGLTDPATDLSLMDFLRSALPAAGAELMVTGHSLGGGLTTVVASWLYDQLPKSGRLSGFTITPYTFAAPSAGNAAFAAHYDAIFGANSYRCLNTQDIVPMAYTNPGGIQAEYPPPGQLLGDYSDLLWWAVEGLKLVSGDYAQTNSGGVGTTFTFTGPPPPRARASPPRPSSSTTTPSIWRR